MDSSLPDAASGSSSSENTDSSGIDGSIPASSEDSSSVSFSPAEAGTTSNISNYSEDTSSSWLLPAPESNDGVLMSLASVMPAAAITDFATLNDAVQNIVSSGRAGIVYIENDINFTSTINITQSADITFVASRNVILHSYLTNKHFNISGASADVSLTFSSVILDGNSTGGGISFSVPTLTLTGAILQNNKSSGTIISSGTANLTLESSTLKNNIATNSSVSVKNGSITLSNTKILSTTGNAISVNSAAVPFAFSMTNSAVDNNTYNGITAAGINLLGSNITVNILNSSISGNTTSSSYPAVIQGGGLRVVAPTSATSGNLLVNITDSMIANNAVRNGDRNIGRYDWGGAGIYVASREQSLTGNDSAGSHVAVTTNITNTTFSGNQLDGDNGYGTAVYNDGHLNIYGSNFSGNGMDITQNIGTVNITSAASNGGSLTIHKDAAGNPTIFENNVAYVPGIVTNTTRMISNNPAINVLVEDAIFQNNTGIWGMALYLSEYRPGNASSKIIRNSTFTGNISTMQYANKSAAVIFSMYNDTTFTQEAKIENSLFDSNIGTSEGAAVFFGDNNGGGATPLSISGSTFSNNRVSGTGNLLHQGGAGLYMEYPTNDLVSITDTTFTNNFATQGRYTSVNPFEDRCINIISSTQPFTHPFNNLDINYTGGVNALIFTVSFDSQGGTPVNPIQAFNSATIPAPTVPTKTNYTFKGWYLDTTYTTPWEFNTNQVTADTTLYAKWDLNQYTISFNTQGGSTIAPVTASHGSIIIPPAPPTRTGYTFLGWFKDSAYAAPWNFNTDVVLGNTVLFAKWELISIPSSSNPPASSSAPVSSSSTLPVSSSTPAPTSTTSTTPISSISPTSSTPVSTPSSITSSPPASSSNSNPPDNSAAQQREETRDRLIEAGVPTLQIGNTQVPLFGGVEGFTWSLFSLLLAVAALLTSIVIAIKALVTRKQTGNSRINLFGFISIATGLISFLAFFIVYSLQGVMVLIDAKTILFLVLLLAELFIYFIAKHKHPDAEES